MENDSEYPISAEQIDVALFRIRGAVKKTPVLTSSSIDCLVAERFPGWQPQLFFKCENFQTTGSFKCRGAVNAVSKLKNAFQGFVTHSSGNHGQALAFASRDAGRPCVVVVPDNAPQTKVDAIRSYGAEIVFVSPSIQARKDKCHEIAFSRGFAIIDPHDDWDVMEGQGTLAAEWIPAAELDGLLVSVGGGGLAGGILQYSDERYPHLGVYCVEPEGKKLAESLAARRRLWTSAEPLPTIADGVRVRPAGARCFEVLMRHPPREIFSVSNSEITEAWKLIHDRLKIVIEPSAALPLAAVLRYGDRLKSANVNRLGLVICGGNVDFAHGNLLGS